MSLQVETILAGALFTNTYVLSKGNDVIIIDPACKIEKLEPYLIQIGFVNRTKQGREASDLCKNHLNK